MSAIEDQETIMLRVAQFKSYIRHKSIINEKNVNLFLRGLDVNLKVPDRSSLKEPRHEPILGNSLLYLAFEEQEIDAYNVLICNGADFTIKNKKGNSVLHEVFHGLSTCFITEKYKFKRIKSSFIESTLSAHIKYSNLNNPSDPTGLTHFHVACATNNIQAVQFFLNNGVPVNQVVIGVRPSKFFEKYTPLHFAVQFGCIEVIEILLTHGANVKLEDTKGKTPLHICLEKNIELIDSAGKVCLPTDIELNEKIINLLVNHYVSSKFLHLSVASSMQNVFELEKCLNQGTDVNQSMPRDSQIWPGYSALHFAARVNIDIVQLLIQHGADLQAKKDDDVTPFDMCINRYKVEDIFNVLCLLPSWENIVLSDGQTKLVDVLFALRSLETIKTFLQGTTENVKVIVPFDSPLWPGFTILHMAILFTERRKCKTDYKYEQDRGSLDPDLTIITECLKQDADVTVKDHRSWTPIHLAFRLEKEKTVNLLLQYHHKMDNCVDKDNLSHLHIACASGNHDLVKKLLWNNAEVNIVYKGESVISSLVYPGWTPLHVAVYKNDCEIVKLLLKFSADIHAIDRYGFTPIHGIVSFDPLTELSQVLFNLSNLRDTVVKDTGLSYLHVACWNNNVDAVNKLLDSGAEINRAITYQKSDSKNSRQTYNLKACDGCTPLHCVMLFPKGTLLSDRTELASLMIARGADILIKTANNVSPLIQMLRYRNGFIDIVIEALKCNIDLLKRVETETGVTLLHLACYKFDVDLIKELLDNGADVNAQIHENSTIWRQYTCLHVLLSRNDDMFYSNVDIEVIVRLLLSRNADVTLSNSQKDTPLHMAYRQLPPPKVSHHQFVLLIASLLMKAHKNFEVNPTNAKGISHFHIACHIFDVDVVENFLEYDVEVNARIDPLYDRLYLAANTPLHLATKRLMSERSPVPFSKSFAQLKIIDLLIKRGADVNAEDILGQTPAHWAALYSSLKENPLQRLIAGGADTNARNMERNTPLGMLLQKPSFTHEQVRHFLTLGCQFNAFNTVTEKGYIACANARLSHVDMQSLLLEAFVNFLDLIKADAMNRTAIHNVVSIGVSELTDTQYTDLFDLSMKFGCDLDDQDYLGRTALHVAALFRNESAVEGLLLAGADINITDSSGKTPFAYIFDPCHWCASLGNRRHDQYSHGELFKIFIRQTKKMEFCNIYVNESNQALLNVALERFGSADIENHLSVFFAEFGQIVPLTLEPYSLTAADFVSNDSAILDYPLMSLDKRKAIKAFFQTNKRHFQEQFKTAAGIFQLQYRQAVRRRNIINAAQESLSSLMGFSLPDLCSHIVLRMLKNHELQNLISSTV